MSNFRFNLVARYAVVALFVSTPIACAAGPDGDAASEANSPSAPSASEQSAFPADDGDPNEVFPVSIVIEREDGTLDVRQSTVTRGEQIARRSERLAQKANDGLPTVDTNTTPKDYWVADQTCATATMVFFSQPSYVGAQTCFFVRSSPATLPLDLSTVEIPGANCGNYKQNWYGWSFNSCTCGVLGCTPVINPTQYGHVQSLTTTRAMGLYANPADTTPVYATASSQSVLPVAVRLGAFLK